MRTKHPLLSRILWTTAAILWMVLIFVLSSQDGVQSSDLSARVCGWLGRNFVPRFREWDWARQQHFIAVSSFYVRKAAHAAEYAVQGFLISMAAGSYGLSARKRVLLSLAAGICWAALDELHQTRVAGRSGQIRDVLIDAAGLIAGILCSLRAAAAVHWGMFGVYIAAFLHFTLLGRTRVAEPVFEPRPFTALRRSIWLEEPVPELLRILLHQGPRQALQYVHLLQTWSLRGLALNILLFLPMGIFLPALIPALRGRERTVRRKRRMKGGTHSGGIRKRAGFPWKAFLLCLLISPALEVTQYVTRLGAFDADDLICNAIGAFAGCLLAKILQNCYKKFKK